MFDDDTLWSPLEMTDYGVAPVVHATPAGGDWEVAYLALHPLLHCDIAIRRRGGSGQATARTCRSFWRAFSASLWRATSVSRILAPLSS